MSKDFFCTSFQDTLPQETTKKARKTDKPSLIKNNSIGRVAKESSIAHKRNAECNKSTSSESQGKSLRVVATSSTAVPSSSSTSSSLSKAKKIELMETAEEKVKTFLKPFFAREIISKEDYKNILKKCVHKVYERSKLTPNSDIVDEKVAKLVQAYVTKYA